MDAPWSNKKTLSIKDKMERLSREMQDFQTYISPTKREQLNRDTLLYTVVQRLQMAFPSASYIPFGSYATGLQFPSSDIDVCVDLGIEQAKNKIVKALYRLRSSLTHQNTFKQRDITMVTRARIPVMTIVDENKLSIDITVQGPSYSSNRTEAWLKEYPELKPLFYILKQALKGFRLNNDPRFDPMAAKENGLASYSLVCMIVSFLQIQAKNIDKSKSDYYARLLLGFLEFYSNFNETERVICLQNGGQYYTFDNAPSKYNCKPGVLNIIDPDLPEINVARSTSKFGKIKSMLQYMSEYLNEHISADDNSSTSILSSIISVRRHPYGQLREEGAKFTVDLIYVGDKSSLSHKTQHKASRERYSRKAEPYSPRWHGRGNHRHSDGNEETSSRQGNHTDWKRSNSEPYPNYRRQTYEKEGGTLSREERRKIGYQREYERHRANNRSHLAQHYKQKARQ